jgi:non-homologous end joining protein Ku
LFRRHGSRGIRAEKSEGKTVRGTPQRKMAPVVDLMQAVQKSLAVVEKKPAKPAKKAAARHRKTASAA